MTNRVTIKLTANFERNLADIEQFLTEAQAPQAWDVPGSAGLFSLSREGLGVKLGSAPRGCLNSVVMICEACHILSYLKISNPKARNWPCFRSATGTTSSGSRWHHLP